MTLIKHTALLAAGTIVLLPLSGLAKHLTPICPTSYHCLNISVTTNFPVKLIYKKSKHAFGGEARFIPKIIKKNATVTLPFYPLVNKKKPVRSFYYKFVYVEHTTRPKKSCTFYFKRYSNGKIRVWAKPMGRVKCTVTKHYDLKIMGK